tara:strand:+ start:188 stop:349 length:162 start_codon:yes stop_codon:yes gene_type:complete
MVNFVFFLAIFTIDKDVTINLRDDPAYSDIAKLVAGTSNSVEVLSSELDDKVQ